MLLKRATTLSKSALLIRFKFIGAANVKRLNDVLTFSKETTFHTTVASTRGALSARVFTQTVGHVVCVGCMRRACGERGAQKRNGLKGEKAKRREKGSRKGKEKESERCVYSASA